MWAYMKAHEALVRGHLAGRDTDRATLEGLRACHAEMIARMQHERLIHLVVTLFCALFMLLCLGYATHSPTWAAGLLSLLLLGLVSAYVVHYFRLENGVQRWYRLQDRIDARLGRLTVTPPPEPGSDT